MGVGGGVRGGGSGVQRLGWLVGGLGANQNGRGGYPDSFESLKRKNWLNSGGDRGDGGGGGRGGVRVQTLLVGVSGLGLGWLTPPSPLSRPEVNQILPCIRLVACLLGLQLASPVSGPLTPPPYPSPYPHPILLSNPKFNNFVSAPLVLVA